MQFIFFHCNKISSKRFTFSAAAASNNNNNASVQDNNLTNAPNGATAGAVGGANNNNAGAGGQQAAMLRREVTRAGGFNFAGFRFRFGVVLTTHQPQRQTPATPPNNVRI